MSGNLACIPTPWSERWYRARRSLLPAIGFGACLVAALWLWDRQGRAPHAVGEVDAARIDVAAGAGGILVELPRGPWILFDRVEKNTVLARLDDRPVVAEMATLQADLARLRAELTAADERLALDEFGRGQDYQQENRRLSWQLQEHRLDLLDRRALIETDRVEQSRLETDLGFLLALQAKGVVTEQQIADQRLRLAQVRTRIDENTLALGEARRQFDSVTAELRSYPGLRSAAGAKLLEPVEAAITVGQRRLDEVRVRIDLLIVRSPISGTISAIHNWPGQNIRAGDPIVTVAAEQAVQIVTYVRQEQRLRTAVGMAVTVRLRGLPGRHAASLVARVGPRVEPVPPHHLRDPKAPEWGLPISIQLPRDFALKPGELVDLTFQSNQGSFALRGSDDAPQLPSPSY